MSLATSHHLCPPLISLRSPHYGGQTGAPIVNFPFLSDLLTFDPYNPGTPLDSTEIHKELRRLHEVSQRAPHLVLDKMNTSNQWEGKFNMGEFLANTLSKFTGMARQLIGVTGIQSAIKSLNSLIKSWNSISQTTLNSTPTTKLAETPLILAGNADLIGERRLIINPKMQTEAEQCLSDHCGDSRLDQTHAALIAVDPRVKLVMLNSQDYKSLTRIKYNNTGKEQPNWEEQAMSFISELESNDKVSIYASINTSPYNHHYNQGDRYNEEGAF